MGSKMSSFGAENCLRRLRGRKAGVLEPQARRILMGTCSDHLPVTHRFDSWRRPNLVDDRQPDFSISSFWWYCG
jgi:hypothetical protein